MFKTDEVARFFAAWQGLRAETAIPHYRTLFHDLPNDMIPQLMIYEQLPLAQDSPKPTGDKRYVVRFMGTRFVEFWKQDITGQDVMDYVDPKIASASQRNLAAMLEQPCGLWSIGLYSMENRGELAVESIWLPVANDDGRPRRFLNFGQDLRPPFPLEDDRPNMAARKWVDIGFSVPQRRPIQ